jgi:hypothetical protein
MREEPARAARGIPLRARDGTIRAFAMVDADDYKRLVRHRWCLKGGYAARWVGGRGNRRCERMHRVVAAGDDPRQVDHINRDRLDNRRSNLRLVTRAQQQQNLPSQRGVTSRHRGVSWSKERQRWVASAGVGGRVYHLGRYRSEDEAARVAAAFRREHMPYATD